MIQIVLSLLLLTSPHPPAATAPVPENIFRPGWSGRDTADLISHRWLVTSTEKAGKKTGATAGAMPLYMNFFSNGGFDFVGIGDGDMLTWKYRKGSVAVSRKSDPAAAPEAIYRIEKLNLKTMIISGIQAGVQVRYQLSHQAGE